MSSIFFLSTEEILYFTNCGTLFTSFHILSKNQAYAQSRKEHLASVGGLCASKAKTDVYEDCKNNKLPG